MTLALAMGKEIESTIGFIYPVDPRYREEIPESVKCKDIKVGQPSAEYTFFESAFELLDLCNDGRTKMRDEFRSLAKDTDDGIIDFSDIPGLFSFRETNFGYTRAVTRTFELLTAQLPRGQVEIYNISEFVQLANAVVKDRKIGNICGDHSTDLNHRKTDRNARFVKLWTKEAGKLKAACRAQAEKMSKEDDDPAKEKEAKKPWFPKISVVTGFIFFLAAMFFGFVFRNRKLVTPGEKEFASLLNATRAKANTNIATVVAKGEL